MARLAVARAVADGVDLEPVLRKVGISHGQMEDGKARLAAESQINLLNLVAEAIQDDLLGFHLAETFELREIGLLYFVLASSATLGEALARAERYSTIANEGILWQSLESRDFAVRYNYVGVPRHTDRHQMEFWVTALVRTCQKLTNTSLRPVRVSLAHPRCAESGLLDNYFGCEVAFAAVQDEVAFARGAAQLPIAGADPYLNELLVQYCDDALSRRGSLASPIRASVENAIAPLLPHGKARVGEIAQALGMSRRTLARRLAAENLTFAKITDEMRTDLARHYLRDASLSISRIAWLLGYQEVSAFTHAFRRWTGRTPTQVRSLARSDLEGTHS
ncbi:AraC family transcriptional regulator [Microvirga brassicacearum]|uniref:AraC family transcriptional regulator n=1 Tax=Microvirga brassicacearum TaxID=2580413 RepID=A0A5N3P7U1_9HYPH|nr:AraC family transcriptional regulator [Microvirga brassicacearum]